MSDSTAVFRSSFFHQLIVFVSALFLPVSARAAEWQSVKSLPTQGYTPVFLATTPTGDVVATTFNNSSRGQEVDLPVILIRNPLSDAPSLFAVCTNRFPAKRGYSGVAVDRDGNFYVAADTGEEETSWIRKFDSQGRPVQSFGRGGQISDGARYLGLSILGNRLFTTAGFGELRVYETEKGSLVGSAPKPGGSIPFIRDIAVDPSRQVVFGVAQGAAWVWEGALPDAPGGYRLQRLTQDQAPPVGGEGLTFDPVARKALVPLQPTRELLAIDGAGTTSRSPVVGSQASGARVADAVLLADGRTLFVSDLHRNEIHVMRRQAELQETVLDGPSLLAKASGREAAPRVRIETVASSPATAGGSVRWIQDYESGLKESKSSGRPLLVYFRSAAARETAPFESGYLASPEFTAAAGNFITVWVDVDKERLLAQQLGVYRVPHIALYTPSGERLAAFSGTIDARQLSAELQKAAPAPGGR